MEELRNSLNNIPNSLRKEFEREMRGDKRPDMVKAEPMQEAGNRHDRRRRAKLERKRVPA